MLADAGMCIYHTSGINTNMFFHTESCGKMCKGMCIYHALHTHRAETGMKAFPQEGAQARDELQTALFLLTADVLVIVISCCGCFTFESGFIL